MNRCRLPLLALALALVLGCSGSKGPPRGPVKGRVTLGGKAVPNATVVFESKVLGVSQTASTDDDGRYEFVAYNAAGLPAGSYKVAVSSGRFLAPGEEVLKIDVTKKPAAAPKKAAAAIPEKYLKADTSGLTADVKADDNPPFDFDLKP